MFRGIYCNLHVENACEATSLLLLLRVWFVVCRATSVTAATSRPERCYNKNAKNLKKLPPDITLKA